MYVTHSARKTRVADGRAVDSAEPKPWEREGISRRHWYRRTRNAAINWTRPAEDLRWYCVHTRYGCEDTAAVEIGELGFQVFAPTIFMPATRRRRNAVGAMIPARPASSEPLFRDYIFSQFRLVDRWQRIRALSSVDGILGAGSLAPQPVPERAIELIRGRCDAFGCFHENAEQPNSLVGAMLRVIDGAFSSFSGPCDWSEDGRVRVLLSMFGRECPIEIDEGAVELV